jgi:hypothetical protein
MEDINKYLSSETLIETLIINDPDFVKGALWGEPRGGHPEGKVYLHIQEVLNNIAPNSKYRMQLRLIALVHDTFKYKVDQTKSKSGENHHAMIARRFAEKYIKNPVTLDIIELHDEAYNAYRKLNTARAAKLIARLGPSLALYKEFFLCDNNTGDKLPDSYEWFNKLSG